MSFRYNENDLQTANGLLQLDGNALIPSNKLPTTLSYADKQRVYFGEIQTLSSSQDTPTGNGQTICKLIRNNGFKTNHSTLY